MLRERAALHSHGPARGLGRCLLASRWNRKTLYATSPINADTREPRSNAPFELASGTNGIRRHATTAEGLPLSVETHARSGAHETTSCSMREARSVC